MSKMTKLLCKALEANIDGQTIALPEECRVVWQAFLDLSRSRGCGPAGPNPITYPEIEAYCRLMRVPLEPRHIQTLVAMDGLWLSKVQASKPPKGSDVLPYRSGEPLTAELLDAVMG